MSSLDVGYGRYVVSCRFADGATPVSVLRTDDLWEACGARDEAGAQAAVIYDTERQRYLEAEAE